MRRALSGLVAIVCILTAVVSPAPARADGTAVLTSSDGATNIPVGEVLDGTLAPGTQEVFSAGGSSNIRCSASSFTATVQTNPAAGGVASTSMTSWNHAGCTTTLPGTTGVTITSTALPYALTFNSGTRVVLITGPIKTITLLTIFGAITCTYTLSSTTTTTYFNATATIVTTTWIYTKIRGSSLCPPTLTYSSTYVLRWRISPVFVNWSPLPGPIGETPTRN